MSGGSWDYLYARVEEASDRLAGERDPLRRAFGKQLALVARALHDLEWVDSHDWGEGDEKPALVAALGGSAPATLAALAGSVEGARAARDELEKLLREAEDVLRQTTGKS